MTLSIPAFHVSSASKVKGKGEVFIASRKSGGATGVFDIAIDVHFDPGADEYPMGSLVIGVNLSDGINGSFRASTIELMNSHGKANPTVFLTGRCASEPASREHKGLRYWLMIASNRSRNPQERESTPDIVGFAIHDRNGARVAYGTGPLRAGFDIDVAPA